MLNRNHTGAKVGMKVNLSRMRKVISFVIVSLLMFSILLPGCKKKEDEIDLVGVNIDVSLTDPSFADLNAVGGWVYISGGVRGIIIYRKSLDEFVSYERNCPYKPNDACAAVSVQSDNVSAKDNCCGSGFSITDGGNVIQGPASRPLKQYATSLHGNIVHIQN